MTPYATADDLATYMDPDAETPTVPPLATVLLRSAQSLVLDATAAAVYSTNSDGHATQAGVREAIRDAIMEQASAWSLHSIDPRKGAGQVKREVSSKSLLGGSVSYVANPSRDTYLADLASGTHLTPAAWTILDNAGLISNAIGGGRVAHDHVTIVATYGGAPIEGDTP